MSLVFLIELDFPELTNELPDVADKWRPLVFSYESLTLNLIQFRIIILVMRIDLVLFWNTGWTIYQRKLHLLGKL